MKFNNLGLAQGMALTFYTGVIKGLKLKVRNFWGGVLPTFKVTGEKLVGDEGGEAGFLHPPSWIGLNEDTAILYIFENNASNMLKLLDISEICLVI